MLVGIGTVIGLVMAPMPAASASGFSSNGAVSTNTFSSPPKRAIPTAT